MKLTACPAGVQLEQELVDDRLARERVDRRGQVDAGVSQNRAVARVEGDQELRGDPAAPEPEEARGVELDDRLGGPMINWPFKRTSSSG